MIRIAGKKRRRLLSAAQYCASQVFCWIPDRRSWSEKRTLVRCEAVEQAVAAGAAQRRLAAAAAFAA
jgi:hypothetical protein